MNELRVLDMSEDRDNHPFEMFVSIGSKTNEFLNKEKVLENLTTLDISGNNFIYLPAQSTGIDVLPCQML